MKKRRKNRPKDSVSLLKEKLWKVFSLYIRRKNADDLGYVECATCLRTYLWTEMQAGHWLGGHHNSVMFNELNVHPQCYYCNITLKSNPQEYWLFMEKKHGRKVMEVLLKKNKELKQFKPYELNEMIEDYSDRLVSLDMKEAEND